MLNICLTFSVNTGSFLQDEAIENAYQNLYKKVAQFYYAHPKYKLAMYISGTVLDYIDRKHPEYTKLLSELSSRKQIEMLGGGYYNPAFPLLFPQDRSGQIEMMTQTLRKTVGKRPRGMVLSNSIWDSSMICALQTCGMEYVFLDSSLIPSSKNEYLPLIVNEQGKNIKVLSVNRQIEPAVFDETSPEVYVSNILKTVKKTVAKSSCRNADRIICLNIGEPLFKHLFNSGWIEGFYSCIEKTFSSSAVITLPGDYIHSADEIIPSYIPAGIRSDIAQWAKCPYSREKIAPDTSLTIQDFLMTYAQNQKLYNRMLYLSMLVNQSHGDKSRRKSAREKLWNAQSGEAYVCSPDGIFANNAVRQNCYKMLTEVEKLLRECNPRDMDFEESVASYDYNNDGRNEYVCRMKNYTACISLRGAQVNELDILQNSGNYADNLNRIEKYDKFDDDYERGFFVEHLFTDGEFKDYKKGLPAGNGIFSRTNFTQLDFDARRHEIKLLGKGEYSSLGLPVSLRKKYIASSNGFTIQIILKNESPLPLKGVLAVESNFAQTDFSACDKNSYKVQIITAGESHEFEVSRKGGSSKNVSYLQVTDISNDVSFVFEPNEDCECLCRTLVFRRPVLGGDGVDVIGNTFVSAMCWNVDLAAGMEMEKNINFAIITPKKRQGTRKKSQNV